MQAVQKMKVKMAIGIDKLGEQKCPLMMMMMNIYPRNIKFLIKPNCLLY